MNLKKELDKHNEIKYNFNFKNGMKFWKKLRTELTVFLTENKFHCSNTQHSSCISYREKEGDTSGCFCEVDVHSFHNYDEFRSNITLEICEKTEYYIDLLHLSMDELGYQVIEEFEDGEWKIYPVYQNTDTATEYHRMLGV